MRHQAKLIIDFKSYWHAGTGLSAGTQTDALTERDTRGLPCLSGRHLKGMLRDALHRASLWGWFDNLSLPDGPAADLETLLFGSASQSESRHQTLPGMLAIGDGNLPQAEANWLAEREHVAYRSALFCVLHSTAISESGSAQAGSLRSMEVALPLALEARLEMLVTAADSAHRAQQQAWLDQPERWQPVEKVLCLIDSLGAKRSRGLGEAIVQLRPAQTRS